MWRMEIWSKLCPTTLTGTGDSSSHNSRRNTGISGGKSDANSKRSSFSSKQAQSLPVNDTLLRGPVKDVLRQFSLSDLAMQNNCTVLNNKVAPVVIKNCKEEYQVRQCNTKSAGRLHDLSSEHELLLDKFFLLKDNFVGIDRHDSSTKHGVPNLRMSQNRHKIYAIGQPTTNGLKKFTTTLLSQHKFVYYVNVRAVPTLFLRRSDDFIPYSAYSKGQSEIYTTERQLNDAEREMQLQALEIASSNSGTFFYYNVLDASPDEPHMYKTTGFEDLVTSRQMYAKIQSKHQNFKYKRLVLPNLNEPTSEWLDALMDIAKECNFLHDDDSAIVFQGLTGEGPATLAMILTMLAVIGETNLKNQEQKVLGLVEMIQRSAKWREFIMQKLIASSRLQGKVLRREVNAVIASCATPSVVSSTWREAKQSAKQKKTELELGLRCLNQKSGEEKEKETDEIADKLRELPNFKSLALSLTLRDMSEMSLPKPRNRCDTRTRELCRYEVYDEECLLRKLLLNPNLYHFLLIFRAYVKEQAATGKHKHFSQWLNHRPHLIFDLAQTSQYQDGTELTMPWQLEAKIEDGYSVSTDPTYHRVVGMPFYGIAQSLPDRFAELVTRLCGPTSRKRYSRVVFVNVWDETVFYSIEKEESPTKDAARECEQNGVVTYSTTQWELRDGGISCMHGATSDTIEHVEAQMKNIMNKHPEDVLVLGRDFDLLNAPLKTTRETIEELPDHYKDVTSCCERVSYMRIPLPRFRIPKFSAFDKVVSLVRDDVQSDGKTACVFFCKDGKRRTTNLMAAACLVYGHMKEFSHLQDNFGTTEADPWAPDVEFTRGEFKVVLELLQILPDCYVRKKEVDLVLDVCHESMSTMHYHLRESLNPSYKMARRAKTAEEFLKIKHRSFQSLEFYVFLILFNCYLKQGIADLWRSLSFEDWMLQYAARLGVLELLNNFGFMSFGEDVPLNLMQCRWLSTPALLRRLFCDPNVAPMPACTRHKVVGNDIEFDEQSQHSSTYSMSALSK